MSIPNWTYLPEYSELAPEILDAMRRVLESGWVILGERVRELEERFSAWVGLEHGIGVNSGTDALFLGLKALGVGPDDEVMTVTNTAVPTVSAIRATGARPVFVDIHPDTYLMNVELVEAQITPRTRVLLPVHLYGQSVDMDPLLEIATRHGLSVLEDCAQSHGARYKGRMTGSMGDIGAFSFYPTKVLGGLGDGGMCVTSSGELAEKLRMLRFYGMKTQYYSEMEGFNSRLDELQAAILLVKLKGLDRAVEIRQHIAARYDEELRGAPLALPAVKPFSTHCYFLYVVRTPKRDEAMAALAREGIEARVHFPTPIHEMRGYQFLGYQTGDFPESERAAREIMSLPLYPGLADDQIRHVASVLKAALR
ncbi:MAG: DegT/DnrJ/EryC1/StrS family aminotransferase [Chloroflexi bacterium]|nr:DegT/DnrJ/EryC1/StrS family aminotransferase [Chloroflexota bacterium]